MNSSTPTPLQEAAAAMPAITLEEMESVKLLNRVDSKFVTDTSTLLKVLEDARKAGYSALQTGGSKLIPYSSVYYDTPGMKMFRDHHNRHLVREKVRTRVYLNSGLSFLEIKLKNNHGRTKKKRTPIPESELKDFTFDDTACAYLAAHSAVTADMITPVLSTNFTRITLVNSQRSERITIDTDLHFENYRTGNSVSLDGLAIIELKQDSLQQSTMRDILLDHRVKQMRVSKYCIAVVLTDTDAKGNRFKPKVRTIEKIMNKKFDVI